MRACVHPFQVRVVFHFTNHPIDTIFFSFTIISFPFAFVTARRRRENENSNPRKGGVERKKRGENRKGYAEGRLGDKKS